MRDSVSEADWRVVVARAVDQARKGNADARGFLASYLLGKPKAADPTIDGFELSGLDSLSGIAAAGAKIARAAAGGRLPIGQARALASLLEVVRAGVFERDVEDRLNRLEADLQLERTGVRRDPQI